MIYHYRRKKPALRVPSAQRFAVGYRSPSLIARHLLFALRIAAVTLLIIAMARPQRGRDESKRRTEGLDIELVIDTSGSMRALDFMIEGRRENRIDVVKQVITEFVKQRPDDRIGTVVFGTHAFAQAPMTLDHDILMEYIDHIEVGLAGDATAIGDGIGVAVNRLKALQSKNRIIILLTDGASNAGKVEPTDAAQAAKALGIKVYTIGVGTEGFVSIPTQFGMQKIKADLDETLLKGIAQTTDGRYFRAMDTEALREVYRTIDSLEKSVVEVKVFHNTEEQFAFFVWPGLLLLLMELGLGITRLRNLP